MSNRDRDGCKKLDPANVRGMRLVLAFVFSLTLLSGNAARGDETAYEVIFDQSLPNLETPPELFYLKGELKRIASTAKKVFSSHNLLNRYLPNEVRNRSEKVLHALDYDRFINKVLPLWGGNKVRPVLFQSEDVIHYLPEIEKPPSHALYLPEQDASPRCGIDALVVSMLEEIEFKDTTLCDGVAVATEALFLIGKSCPRPSLEQVTVVRALKTPKNFTIFSSLARARKPNEELQNKLLMHDDSHWLRSLVERYEDYVFTISKVLKEAEESLESNDNEKIKATYQNMTAVLHADTILSPHYQKIKEEVQYALNAEHIAQNPDMDLVNSLESLYDWLVELGLRFDDLTQKFNTARDNLWHKVSEHYLGDS